MFCQYFHQKSIHRIICLRFNFSADIPLEQFQTKGASIIFTVWHNDRLLPNDFLGEVVIKLIDIPQTPNNSLPGCALVNTSAMIINLKRHMEPTGGGYQVKIEFIHVLLFVITSSAFFLSN